MNTIENNKLIAEFMDIHEIMLDEYSNYEIDVIYPILGIKPHHHKGLIIHESDLQFHTSWDWLMPVVSKMRYMYNHCEVGGTEYIEDLISVIAQGCVETHISQVYEGMVGFIKWYNENK